MSGDVAVKWEGIAFPRMCPACGGRGEVVIPRAKAFQRGDHEDGVHEVVVEFPVLYCRGCAEKDARERKTSGVWDALRRLCTDPGTVLGAVVVGVVGLLFLEDGLKKLSPLVVGFSLLPLGTAWFLLRQSWNKAPGRFLPPPTTVTASVDFSDSCAAEYEPEWLRFTFQHAGYAAAFRELNAGRLWDPGGGEAMAARQKRAWKAKRMRWILWAAGGALGVWMVLSWVMGWDF